MPKGFYLKKGIWYKRILKPDPETGVWQLRAESTTCKADQGQQAIDYINHRVEELEKTKRLLLAVDPGKVTMNQFFDDFLAAVPHGNCGAFRPNAGVRQSVPPGCGLSVGHSVANGPPCAAERMIRGSTAVRTHTRMNLLRSPQKCPLGPRFAPIPAT